MGMRVCGGTDSPQQSCRSSGSIPPIFGVVFMFPQPPPTAKSSNCAYCWLVPQFKRTVYRETLYNHVTHFVLPRIYRFSIAWLQAHHVTPQGREWLSPKLWLALSERLHLTDTPSLS